MGSKLIAFEISPFSKTRVIGKSVIVKLDNEGSDDPTIPDLWAEMKDDGSLDTLLDLPDRVREDPDTVGWMGEYSQEDSIMYHKKSHSPHSRSYLTSPVEAV